jgi:hypothetical protein
MYIETKIQFTIFSWLQLHSKKLHQNNLTNVCIFFLFITHCDNNIMESISIELILITSYFEFEIITRLVNQFNDTIIIWPPSLKLFIKSICCFESRYLFSTLCLILYTFSNHYVTLRMGLYIRMGFPTLEFLLARPFEPSWLLLSCIKYTP